MALISELEKKIYLQKFKWAISYSDGDVTTHKMLDFVNQRTGHQVFYKPTLKTMCVMFFGFIAVMGLGVIVYTKLKFLWTHWLVWFIGVLLIYITCVSGVVYDIIHDVPFVGRDRETGEAVIFTNGVNFHLILDSRAIRRWRFNSVNYYKFNWPSFYINCYRFGKSKELIQSPYIRYDCFVSNIFLHNFPLICVQIKKLVWTKFVPTSRLLKGFDCERPRKQYMINCKLIGEYL